MRLKLAALALMAVTVSAIMLFMSNPGVSAGQEDSFWKKVKKSYVEWDDNAKTGKATEVAGVRGLGVEKALGAKGYDWAAVKAMEDYKLSLDDQKKFLQEGQLGPYQGN